MKRTLALILIALTAFAAVVCWGGNGFVAHADDPQFTAAVKVGLASDGELYYGDTARLYADIQDANMAYTITWQADDGSGWYDIQQGSLGYTVQLTPECANRLYRVVLQAEDSAL